MLLRVLLTLFCLVVWLVVFCLGAFIDTNPLRATIGENFNTTDFVLIMLAWIPTNLALLSILAGLSGALSRSLLRSVEVVVPEKRPLRESSRILGGAVAGFLFYLALMAGAFLMMNQPFETTTPEQYFRVAGVISFVGFLAGFRPDLLRRVLSKLPGF
jgi:hypothetical protein